MKEQLLKTDNQPDKPTLLLVDDDPLIAESLGFLLRKHYHVMIADSRSRAIEQLAAEGRHPDIALIDLGLPPTPHKPDEGFELVRELIAQPGDMKILVLSGQDNDVNIQHALRLGAVDFIAKPADPELLMTRLQHHLRLREIEQQNEAQSDSSIVGESASMNAILQQIEQLLTPYPIQHAGCTFIAGIPDHVIHVRFQ